LSGFFFFFRVLSKFTQLQKAFHSLIKVPANLPPAFSPTKIAQNTLEPPHSRRPQSHPSLRSSSPSALRTPTHARTDATPLAIGLIPTLPACCLARLQRGRSLALSLPPPSPLSGFSAPGKNCAHAGLQRASQDFLALLAPTRLASQEQGRINRDT